MGREDQGERPPMDGASEHGRDAPSDPIDAGSVDASPVDTGATLAPDSSHALGLDPQGATIVVEGYDDVAPIGRGGFATVWRARQITMDRVVALKVMDRHLSDDDAVRRFARESAALVELSWNPHIVHVYDTGVTADGHPYLAMEYLPSGTLGNRVRDEGPLPAADLRRIGLSLTDAVAAAHDAGVLHRDLKPDNVLLGRRGEVKLADFGIARIAGHDATTTASGQAFRGTIQHAAPELLDGQQPSAASDVWSIGSTLYTVASGHAPFASTTDDESVTAIIRRTLLDAPPALPDTLPPDLARVISACLSKDPEDRPATVAEVHTLLDACAVPADDAAGAAAPLASGAGAVTTAPPTPATAAGSSDSDSRGRRVALIGGGVLALIVAAVLAAVLLGGGDDNETAGDGDATTTTSEAADIEPEPLSPEDRARILDREDGPTSIRPLAGTGLADTSDELRERLEVFASSTTSPAVREAKFNEDTDADDLDFGELPASMDYSATNLSKEESCRRILLSEQTVLGAAGGIWFNGNIGLLVNAIQLDSPEAARQYYWATAVFHGLNSSQCRGWPADGLAIDPTDLVVDRREFGLDASPDELMTATSDDYSFGGIDMALTYQSVSLIGDTVLVASAGSTTTTDPSALTEPIAQAIRAFSG